MDPRINISFRLVQSCYIYMIKSWEEKKEEKAKFVYKDRAKTCLGFVKSASFINYPTLKD